MTSKAALKDYPASLTGLSYSSKSSSKRCDERKESRFTRWVIAAREGSSWHVLAGNVQPVCETLHRGFAGRGLPQWHCRADLQAWLLQYVVQTVDSALSMLVLLPLLKIKAGNYFEVKGSLCFQGKVSLKIIVMLRLSLVKDLLYIQGREISNPYKQILLGA